MGQERERCISVGMASVLLSALATFVPDGPELALTRSLAGLGEPGTFVPNEEVLAVLVRELHEGSFAMTFFLLWDERNKSRLL